ncbi:MAG: dihydrofolate reductase [Planctomycetota bacterium]
MTAASDPPESSRRLSMIVAVAENGVIGRDGDLPWKLSSDLKRFRTITMGHPLIMGRATYDSIGRPLPGRTSIVLTRNPEAKSADDPAAGPIIARSLEEALDVAANCEGGNEVFIIGGRAAFETGLRDCDRLYLTTVHAEVEGDVHLDLGSLEGWRETHAERIPAGERDDYETTYSIYDRDSA